MVTPIQIDISERINRWNRDLAVVLRAYGFWGLDPDDGNGSTVPSFSVLPAGSSDLCAASETPCAIFEDPEEQRHLPGLESRKEQPTELIYGKPGRFRGRTPAFRPLLAFTSFIGNKLEPIWQTKDGRTVLGWWSHLGRRHLLCGLQPSEEMVRYTHGDPSQVLSEGNRNLWGGPHEQPAYLYAGNVFNGYELIPWVDRLGAKLAACLSELSGLPLFAPLPSGAKGAIILTGDDDQAWLEKYEEQARLIGELPITYCMLPHSNHTPETIAELPRTVEFGVHVDALEHPERYRDVCLRQTEEVRRLLNNRGAQIIRNHGHLNQDYWGHLSAWEEAGLDFGLNIRGIDGTCITGSYLPFRVRRPEGTWSSHTALLTTFSDTMLSLQNWSERKQISVIRRLASQIERTYPGILVFNFHPQNVSGMAKVHRAVVALSKRRGWVAFGAESFAAQLANRNSVRLSWNGEELTLTSDQELDDLIARWPHTQESVSLRINASVTPLRPPRKTLSRWQRVYGLCSPEADFVNAWCGRQASLPAQRAAEQAKPSDSWHSWDATPWEHPWLSQPNLIAATEFQNQLMMELQNRYEGHDLRKKAYAFVGNLANNMTMRAFPMRKRGYDVGIVVHPQDSYIMSQPGWELSDAVLDSADLNVAQLGTHGVALPHVDNVVFDARIESYESLFRSARSAHHEEWVSSHPDAAFLRQQDVLRWPGYFTNLPLLRSLRNYHAALAAQAPYLPYLAGIPYLAAQTGGDLWFEAARNDQLGKLQRTSYRHAAAILATNPWAYANARRYGFNHVLYVPLMVDTEIYCPRESEERGAWQAKVGGDFFVLATARLDSMWKKSEIGIEGFARFSAKCEGARLVLIGWGHDMEKAQHRLSALGLAEKTVLLPVSGKRRLIEYLRSADCLLDQFRFGYYGATALEAMSCGVPVIMRIIEAQYDALCPTGSPPIENSASYADVENALLHLARSPEYANKKSAACRRWIELNHSVDAWGNSYGLLLYSVARKSPPQFARSPLAMPLTAEEVTYHSDMLASAPPFPNYEI